MATKTSVPNRILYPLQRQPFCNSMVCRNLASHSKDPHCGAVCSLHAFSGSAVRSACSFEVDASRRTRCRREPCMHLCVPCYTFLSGLPLGGLWRVCRGMQVPRCSSLSCDIKLGGIAAFAEVSAVWSTHRMDSRQHTPVVVRQFSQWMPCVCCG